MNAGDYYYGVTFGDNVSYQLAIVQYKDEAKISQTKATITAGFTKKLSVEGAKVTKWSTSKKTVASFDSKGNLVIKTRFVNNDFYKVVALENIKIVVKDENGKLVGTYKAKKKSVTVPSRSTKDLSFTINKSSLKKKTADLRNSTIKCDGTYVYYY